MDSQAARAKKLEAAKKKLAKHQSKLHKSPLSDDKTSDGRSSAFSDTLSAKDGDTPLDEHAPNQSAASTPLLMTETAGLLARPTSVNSGETSESLDTAAATYDSRDAPVLTPSDPLLEANADKFDAVRLRLRVVELEELNRNIEQSAERAANEMATQVARIRDKERELEEQMAALNVKSAEVASNNNRSFAEAQEGITRLREEKQTLAIDSDKTIKHLSEENESLRKAVQLLEEHKQNTSTEAGHRVKELEQQLHTTTTAATEAHARYTEQLTSLENTIRELQQKVPQEDAVRSQEDEVSRLRNERHALEEKVHRLVKETETLKSALLRSDMDKEGLENRYEGLLSELNGVKATVSARDEIITKLEDKVRTMTEENQFLEEARDVAVAELAGKMQEIVRENDVLTKEKAQLIEDVDAARRVSIDISRGRDDERRESVLGRSSSVLSRASSHVGDAAMMAAQRDLMDENKVLKTELDRIRLAQAEIGSVLLNNSNPAADDLVRVLQRRCDELAADVQTYRQQAGDARGMAEQAKLAFHDRDVEQERVKELQRELEACSARFDREQAIWRSKEQTLHAEVARLGKGAPRVSDESSELRKYIMALGGQSDTNVVTWAKWAVAEHERLREELREAHTIVDVQHQKILSGTPDPTAGTASSTAIAAANTAEQETQTDPMLAFARLSTIKANLVEGPKRRSYGGMRSSSSRSSIAGGSRRGSINSVVSSPAGPSFPLSPAAQHFPSDAQSASNLFTLQLELSTLRGQLAKLTSRYAELQQTQQTTQQHLDHQMRVNREMKKLIVGASVGVSTTASSSIWGAVTGGGGSNSGQDGNVLEKYADAMERIGILQEEVERWRRRCEEVEEVVEAVVLQQAEQEEEDDGYEVGTEAGSARASVEDVRGRGGVAEAGERAVLEDTTSLFAGSTQGGAFDIGFGNASGEAVPYRVHAADSALRGGDFSRMCAECSDRPLIIL
ncbi:hypothetical protein HK097_000932 [Rhizophlyctis rosea]|uniref:Uncharacterized protein n=1 Tax=Rhizophlyctis rosea TaxID=64517 RepID=A0AAD5SHM2_9FUNG|nr:hypothetical protein HK097_000932 [Rhizophlyctis rosea]